MLHTVKNSTLAFILVFCFICTFCSNASDQDRIVNGMPLKGKWAMDRLWEDGQAEVAKYSAEKTIYGKVRQFEYIYILVKEEFNRKHNVKTDDYDRKDLFSVMKVNKFARIETDNYPYHLLTSVFFKREAPGQLHKMTHSSQEWCGNTFKLFEDTEIGYAYTYHSYWDGQGDGKFILDKGLVFEDQLSYTLRALDFKEGQNFTAGVVESQLSSKATKPKIYTASFGVKKDKIDGQAAWQVHVLLEEGKVNSYWFATAYPNILLKQQTWDGQNMALKSVERTVYWK